MPWKGLNICALLFFSWLIVNSQDKWSSKHVQLTRTGDLKYKPDEKGNIIPDFSKVGYKAGKENIPFIKTTLIIDTIEGYSDELIQSAIEEVSKKPVDKNGFRGAIFLKKGDYKVSGTIKIKQSGIVLRGEAGTRLIAVGNIKRNLIDVTGNGNLVEVEGSRIDIEDSYIPVGATSFQLTTTKGLKVGDKIVVFRPGTTKWIHDLKMDQIETREGTVQWQPSDYDLHFEREITKIVKNKIFIDNPIVMAIEEKYGGGAIYKYNFDGRINNIGLENILCESEFANDTDEEHGWNAIYLNRVENGWVKNITAKHFGYSSVNLGEHSRNITVDSCQYLEPKSQITGSRRYSFNNDGQMNLIMNCLASDGRHDYVTGQKVRGPNVFYNCRSVNAKADIGPHHRWAMGTLYDNIITDGEINIQDRGNWGTGHGWSGVNQVIWNCEAAKAAIQDPWVTGKNYVVGLKANRYEGRLKDRLQTEWEGTSGNRLVPPSLYRAQLNRNKQFNRYR